MGTSIYDDGIVAIAPSLYGTDDDYMGAQTHRDAFHNLLHAADQYGQVRVNYHPWADAVDEGQDTFETIDASPTAGQWYQVGGSPFGHWPLTLRADGSGYRLRVRIGGEISAGPGTSTFRVIIRPLGPLTRSQILEDADHVFEATTSSTTPAYLSGTSQGDDASSTLLRVTARQASAWTFNQSAFDAVSSASPISVQQVLVAAHVYAKTSSGSSLPRLHALHIAEYVGST